MLIFLPRNGREGTSNNNPPKENISTQYGDLLILKFFFEKEKLYVRHLKLH